MNKVTKYKRNENLFNYSLKHPKLTQAELAKIFHIDQSRISRILNQEAKRRVNGQETTPKEA